MCFTVGSLFLYFFKLFYYGYLKNGHAKNGYVTVTLVDLGKIIAIFWIQFQLL